MSNQIASEAIKLKAAYEIGAHHRKQGLPITTKAAYIAKHNVVEGNTHDLILDMYFSYCKGYRACVPSVGVLENAVNK